MHTGTAAATQMIRRMQDAPRKVFSGQVTREQHVLDQAAVVERSGQHVPASDVLIYPKAISNYFQPNPGHRPGWLEEGAAPGMLKAGLDGRVSCHTQDQATCILPSIQPCT